MLKCNGWLVGYSGAPIFLNLKSQFQLSYYHDLKDDPLCYNLHIVHMVYYFLCVPEMATDLLENFHIFLPQNRFFSKFGISTLKIIPAIPLSRYETEPSGLPFAYGRHYVVLLTCSKMVTNFLEKN